MKSKFYLLRWPRLWASPLMALGLLFLVSTGQSATHRELIIQSRQLVGDGPYYTATPKLSDARITGYLNEAQDYASAYSWTFIQRTTFTLVALTTEYSLPDDFMTVQRVTLKDKILKEMTLDGLDADGRNWLAQGGTPSSYYVRTTTISVIGFNPAPVATTTGAVVLDYISRCAPLVNDTDVPFNGLSDYAALHATLPKFVAYRFFLTVGNAQMANIYAQEFATDIKRLNEIRTSKPNYKPSFTPIPR